MKTENTFKASASAGRASALVIASAVLASAAGFYRGTGLHPIWWLAWLAPVPILLVAPLVRPRTAFLVAAATWFLGSLNMWRYFLKYLFMPGILALLISIIPGCILGLAVLAFRKFAIRGEIGRAALVFPALWVSFEYVNSITSPHSTFGSLSYTQMNFLPIIQLAALTGVWGISFCLCLLPAAVAVILLNTATPAQVTRLSLVVGLVLAAVAGYGEWRLVAAPAPGSTLKVVLMATGTMDVYPHDDDSALQLMNSYVGKIADPSLAGADIVVLPEKIAVVSDEGTKQVDAVFTELARRVHAFILVGIDRGTATRRSNEARVYSPDGVLAATYDKHHLVPRFEDVDRPGSSIVTLSQPSGTWGIEICKDMDFPHLSRDYGARRTALLLVPAWDFTVDGWLHGRMAVMRGIESGFTIVRAAKQGILSVSDDRGRILAEQDAATVPFATLAAQAPVRHTATLYVRWGDWFAWLNLLALLTLLLVPSKRRTTPQGKD